MNKIALANSVHDSTEWELTQFVLIRFLVEAVDAGIIIRKIVQNMHRKLVSNYRGARESKVLKLSEQYLCKYHHVTDEYVMPV